MAQHVPLPRPARKKAKRKKKEPPPKAVKPIGEANHPGDLRADPPLTPIARPENPPPAWLVEDYKNSPVDIRGRMKRHQEARRARLEYQFHKDEHDGPAKRHDKPDDAKVPERAVAEFMTPTMTWNHDKMVKTAYGKSRSDAQRAAICAYARSGVPEAVIIQLVGTTVRALQQWFRQDPDFRRDYNRCRGAWANSAVAMVLEIAQNKQDWKAIQWLLEKTAPGFGPNDTYASLPTPDLGEDEGAVPLQSNPALVIDRLQQLADKARANMAAAAAPKLPAETEKK